MSDTRLLESRRLSDPPLSLRGCSELARVEPSSVRSSSPGNHAGRREAAAPPGWRAGRSPRGGGKGLWRGAEPGCRCKRGAAALRDGLPDLPLPVPSSPRAPTLRIGSVRVLRAR